MSTVALYDTEENSESSLLRARIEQYIRSGVLKYTGLNLEQFLSLPKEIVNWIFSICETQAKKEGAALTDIQQQIDLLKQK